MSSPHTWNLLCSGVSSEDAAVLLQGMMKWKKVKSQLMSSTSCSSGAPHSMRYRLLCCACKHCADAVPYLHCAWRLKVLVCQEAATVDMHELGDHHCRARTPSNSCITLRQRHFIKELARENLVPMRIRHALGPKFGIRPAALPSLRTVQNIVHHFRRTRLGGNDKRKAIMEAVRASAFSGRDGDHDAFTFTSTYDGSVVPEVGNGSDARPFLVGMTTKALLRNSARDPGTFVLHLDATFKLITSQLQREHCAAALVALRCMYARVNGAELQVKFVLGDADKAQHKAFHDVFADRSFTYLMCFYHVVAKLHLTAFTATGREPQTTGVTLRPTHRPQTTHQPYPQAAGSAARCRPPTTRPLHLSASAGHALRATAAPAPAPTTGEFLNERWGFAGAETS
ncbi:hypothetical protein PC129_g7287 [Phytophthora cactorum]|uniref:MULE transposase domain-containing protein n=1 Tax=Phytophthora cactorum TaxID=29920 RepID=A0A8T1IAG0_9STRA|nr:hypothetical protein PC129_g7287 [Phytophthora cactorum]